MNLRMKKKHKIGESPGSVLYTGDKKEDPVRLTLIVYDAHSIRENTYSELGDWLDTKDEKKLTWLHVEGLHREDLVKIVGNRFGIHPLVMEDIANVNQRPKIEEFPGYIFFSLKGFTFNQEDNILETEQFSIIFGKGFVISFQENRGDRFRSIEKRLKEPSGRLRGRKSDYLAYAILDTLVDHYFQVLGDLDLLDEEMEETLMINPGPDTVQKLHDQKRRLITLRRNVWPLRDALVRVERLESVLIEEQNQVYFRDVHDHLIQILDMVETRRELNSGFLDIYLSSLSNRMNEVMKVLTLIATIFIPLTFIAGIYGMNFQVMPELKWPFGYFAVLGVMAVLGLAMILFFKKKKWL